MNINFAKLQETKTGNENVYNRKATKVVKDTFKQDQKTSDMLAARKAHAKELLTLAKDENDQYQSLVKQKDELTQSLEQTADENEKSVITDSLKDINEQLGTYQSRRDSAKKESFNENKTIVAIKNELVKSHEMVDSQKSADTLREAGSKEIIGAALDEAVQNIDEKMKEEQEKLQEKQDENDATTVEQQTDLTTKMTQLVNQQKITEEDLKGLVVDTNPTLD